MFIFPGSGESVDNPASEVFSRSFPAAAAFLLLPTHFSHSSPMPDALLLARIKNTLVEELMLQVTADQIGDEQPLFGPEGIGLDSVDALQLVVALKKVFGLEVSDGEAARGILKNVTTIAEAIEAK
jgi:acyl carrier protein